MTTAHKSAVEKVRAHLYSGKTITPGEALLVYGILRLASAIEDLRLTGEDIDMVIKVDPEGKRFGEYSLRRPVRVGDTVQIRRGHGYGIPSWVRKTKAAKVVGRALDVASVQFTLGLRSAIVQMNIKELVHVA
jgi:hypothetical protein